MAAPTASTSSQVQRDGRRARRDRSRDLAVDALLDLLDEGVARPTAQQVAERSGVSLRSIFRIFDDVDTLHSEAAARQLERHKHLYVEVPAVGDVQERIRAIVELHDRLYDTVAPVRRAAMRAAPESAPLRDQLQRARTYLRAEIDRLFADELAGDPTTAAALEAALSFDTWDQCATAQGLRGPARKAAIERLLTGLLS